MRNLIAFLSLCAASAVATAAAPAAAQSPARPLTLAEKRAQEAQAEAELAARIEERIEAMRKMQRERAEQQARARKAVVKKREAAKAVVTPRSTRWAYSGELGPAHWAEINVDWAACGKGKRQSPVDLGSAIPANLEHIAFDYRTSPFTVKDSGHTIEVGVGEGNFITVGGRRYDLVQFHFHNPSEVRIDGKRFDMEAHLEHRARDGSVAVVAVVLERGQPLAPLQAAFDNLPLEKGSVASPSIVLDPAALLPKERAYYSYAGSMTTPPCTENVLWLVMKQPVAASPAQVELFGRLYPQNARPLQPAAGRVIKVSN